MKLLKKTVRFGVYVAMALIVVLFGIGYGEYQLATKEKSVVETVIAIQAQPGFTRLHDISPYLLDATIAMEDHRFYRHGGVDFFGVGRSLVQLVVNKGVVGGGSTITQQVAKNLFFDFDVSWKRKFAELFIVHELEAHFSKQTILELYVNIINYGDNHMGIDQASRGYFGKSSWDLTKEEAALLAGIPNAPALYQLSTGYEAALVRQKWVVNAMIKHLGYEAQDFQLAQ